MPRRNSQQPGVDPRGCRRASAGARYDHEFGLGVEQRKSFLVLWALDATPIGFSTADRS